MSQRIMDRFATSQTRRSSSSRNRRYRGLWRGLDALEPRVFLSTTDSILHDFTGRPGDGSVPQAGLVLLGGRLYGVSEHGGSHDDGTGGPGLGHNGGVLFSVKTDGTGYQAMHEFGGTIFGSIADGFEPLANLTVFNGKIFGTTPFGGPGGLGTIFTINADGSGYALIHAFGNPADPLHTYDDGGSPFYCSLIPLNGRLYGIAISGGRPIAQGSSNGVLFSISPDGTNYTKLHVFDTGPQVATYELGLATDGTTFYGITGGGGPENAGTIYKLGVDGSNFQIIHTFSSGTEGSGSLGALTLVGNTLFGSTPGSGPKGGGTLFSIQTDGSNFTVVHSFDSSNLINNDGVFPQTGLLHEGNKLYGSATLGGPGFDPINSFAPVGTIYSINTDGTGFTNVLTFNGLVVGGKHDGASPYGVMVSDGTKIYGVTGGGGTSSIGTIFSFPLGGSVGQTGEIHVTDGQATITSGQATPVDFGATSKNQLPLVETFTVTNTGSGTLTLGTASVPGHYTVLDPLVKTLAPGASDTLVVMLPTTTAGTFAGNISFSNNSGGTTSTFKIPVTGTITNLAAGPADLVVSLGALKPPHATYVPGDQITLPVVITNGAAGDAAASAAAPIIVQIRASTDAAYDNTDPLVGEITLTSTVKGGKVITKILKARLPLGFPTGTLNLVAKIDTTDVVAESDETNNTAVAANTFDFARQFGVIPGRPGSTALSFNEADGTLVTLKLTGAGIGTVSADGGSITVTGTTASSNLTISAGKTKTPGDDGRYSLAALTVGTPADLSDHTAIGKITGTTTDLAGDITITGPIATLALGNVAGQRTISIGAPANPPATPLAASLSFYNISDTTLNSAIGLKWLRVSRWLDSDPGTNPDVITAPFIGKLTVPGARATPASPLIEGDFQAGLTLTGPDGGKSTIPTLNSVTITGAASGAPWNITGNIGNVSLTSHTATSDLEITAKAMYNLAVANILSGAHIVLAQGVDPKKESLHSLTVATLDHSELRTAGNIGGLKFNLIDHALIFAGVKDTVSSLPANPADFVTLVAADLPTIGSIIFYTSSGSTSPVLINSDIAAGGIGLASLPVRTSAVDDVDLTTDFGFAVRTAVQKYQGPASAGHYISGADALVS